MIAPEYRTKEQLEYIDPYNNPIDIGVTSPYPLNNPLPTGSGIQPVKEIVNPVSTSGGLSVNDGMEVVESNGLIDYIKANPLIFIVSGAGLLMMFGKKWFK